MAEIKKLLIANRGEIACRIIHTCRRLGIGTVAVFSTADRLARHVRLADEAIAIGEAAPSASYLNQDRLIQAALDSGAQAIHPGYGFLSENAGFARRVQQAGIIFVGPNPGTIERMGSKADAKTTMRAAQVPCVPGYDGADQDAGHLAQQANEIGFPLLIKASAGGGGKGMRVVNHAAEFAEALASARREAAGAFGDEHVILERFLLKPQHVEMQIFGDSHGNYVHLFERDCSSQRRYQKVIEESPSPAINETMRQAMGAAAVAAARAVDYLGAGTVEFIVQGDEFFFMEMNTRLQVEHPVTEMITGQDLVAWQLQVASGQPLPLSQDEIRGHGHAIEVRLYAEDARKAFLPSTGRLNTLRLPVTNESVRVDTGVDEGDSVTVHYDPMIAKIISHGADRSSALAAMQEALGGAEVIGPKTNLDFLAALLSEPVFRQGQINTTYIDEHLDQLLAIDEASQRLAIILACACRLALENITAQTSKHPWRDPWSETDGWSTSGCQPRRWLLAQDEHQHEIILLRQQNHWLLTVAGEQYELQHAQWLNGQISVGINQRVYRCRANINGRQAMIHHQQHRYQFQWLTTHDSVATQQDAEGNITAPMPGRIIALPVQEGDVVAQGDALVVMEAMKMEITLRAPSAGSVAKIHHQVDDFVEADRVLVELSDE